MSWAFKRRGFFGGGVLFTTPSPELKSNIIRYVTIKKEGDVNQSILVQEMSPKANVMYLTLTSDPCSYSNLSPRGTTSPAMFSVSVKEGRVLVKPPPVTGLCLLVPHSSLITLEADSIPYMETDTAYGYENTHKQQHVVAHGVSLR